MKNFEDLMTKRVYDDVHGFVALTELEKQLLNNPYMRRLHFIKQNALANYIFPGATHTRFSHSIGVLYIVEKMIQKLKTLKGKIDITPIDHQVVRLAALLHDVGHYPLSHTIESSYMEYDKFFYDDIEQILDPITGVIHRKKGRKINLKRRNSFLNQLSKNNVNVTTFLHDLDSESKEKRFNHEQIGKQIITNKRSLLYKEIKNILKNTYLETEGDNDRLSDKLIDQYIHLIGQLIIGEPKYTDNEVLRDKDSRDKYYILSLLINSDLDADQLDYMLRDTKNTGIHTTIRVDFLIDNMDICYRETKYGKEKILCFNYKAFESVQQFIFSKAYWYSEILLYNKVCILNEIAKRLGVYMLLVDIPKCRFYYKDYNKFINNLILNPLEYFSFNDDCFWRKVKKIAISKTDKIPSIVKKMANILIRGFIPKDLNFEDLKIYKDNNIFKTIIDKYGKDVNNKNAIYNEIKEEFKNPNLFVKYYNRAFFKPKISDDDKKTGSDERSIYTDRTINILLSPCKESNCNGESSCIEQSVSIIDTEKLGPNQIHKILGLDEKNLKPNAYVQKFVVYDFTKSFK